ncbi:MAG: CPBP family intramembrane glutamic endopeptidase, partial [Chloroflexota bacterium]
AQAAQQISVLLPFWKPYQIENIISGVALRVVLPIVLLWPLGYRRGDFGLSLKNWQVAAPFLALYVLAFLAGGIGGGAFAFLAYAFLYPGLAEEFFYRGLMQRSLAGWLKPASAVVVTALLFAVLHLPDFYFRVYAGDLGWALGGAADAALFGLFVGYGFMRSGSVLPWALLHAFSDVVGF